MNEKQRKGIKALHILSIGEILACVGLLVELSFLTPWLNISALVALVGVIMMLVGVIKLRKVNFFFVIVNHFLQIFVDCLHLHHAFMGVFRELHHCFVGLCFEAFLEERRVDHGDLVA